MAVESRKIEVGTVMPDFNLRDPFGRNYSSRDLMGSKGLLVVFTCNHCPYAQAVWPRLIKLSKDITLKGINVVAINSNAANPDYPDDSVEEMKKELVNGIYHFLTWLMKTKVLQNLMVLNALQIYSFLIEI